MNDFTHLNDSGQANMVDVTEKSDSQRSATAEAVVRVGSEIMTKIGDRSIAKGDLLATARIAGIQAAKKCADLIPLCHPLPLSKVTVDFKTEQDCLVIQASCNTYGKTGVEMEALTAASVAALTVYDMCKALDKGIVIESTRLIEKYGGKSGHWRLTEQGK